MATNDQELDTRDEWPAVAGEVKKCHSAVEYISTDDDESTGQRSRNKKIEQVELNIEKIISRNKSESMFELRKLSHHQHPVSEFSGKQSLEQHLAKYQSPSVNASQQGAEPAPTGEQKSEANVSECTRPGLEAHGETQERFRPDDVAQEIQNLTERRIVNVILQEVGQDIDRMLREGMEQQQSRRRPRARRSRREDDADEMGHASSSPIGRLLSMGARSRRQRGSSRRVRFRPQPPTPNADGRYSVPRRDQSVIIDRLRQSPALNSLGEEARDEVVAEVSNLVSQQLVTSALSGDFRGILELHIQSRAEQINRNRTNPILGQQAYQDPYYLDNHREAPRSSSHSVSSHGVQELHEEMMVMKGQLHELKQMMRLSFDLQLDIQRAIRQEVSAALTAFLIQPTNEAEVGAPSACPIPTLSAQSNISLATRGGGEATRVSKVVNSGHCVICSEGVIDSVIYHCGHMCTCIACGLELKSKVLKCPICRAPITDVIRAYSSMLDVQ